MLLAPIFQKYGQIKRKAGNIMAKEELLFMIQECIALCEQEKETGYQGEATKEQVEKYILPELYELQRKITGNDLPIMQNERYLKSFGYAFKVWNWRMENASKLYLALLKLHTVYSQSGGGRQQGGDTGTGLLSPPPQPSE